MTVHCRGWEDSSSSPLPDLAGPPFLLQPPFSKGDPLQVNARRLRTAIASYISYWKEGDLTFKKTKKNKAIAQGTIAAFLASL